MNLNDACEFTKNGIQICDGGKKYLVRNELQPRVLFVVIIFVLCFIIGICGNSSVLTIIRGIISDRKPLRNPGRRSSDNAILYIAALCIVDFVTSLALPSAIMDSVIGFWMFGTVVCKLHHLCGSVGKVVSTFLITAMSFDRFVAVCHPYQTKYRSRKFVIITIITLWIVGIFLLMPMLIYSKASEVLIHQIRDSDQRYGYENFTNVTRIRVYKCSDMMPPFAFYFFTTRIIPQSGIPLRHIATYTILIAVVYFVCWTPYWLSVLYALYMNFTDSQTQSSEIVLFIIYCVHLLPYFGSASNWILYGLLNTQLQIRHDHSDGNGSQTGYNGGGCGGTSSMNHRGSSTVNQIGGPNGQDMMSMVTVVNNINNISGVLGNTSDNSTENKCSTKNSLINKSDSLFIKKHSPPTTNGGGLLTVQSSTELCRQALLFDIEDQNL